MLSENFKNISKYVYNYYNVTELNEIPNKLDLNNFHNLYHWNKIKCEILILRGWTW